MKKGINWITEIDESNLPSERQDVLAEINGNYYIGSMQHNSNLESVFMVFSSETCTALEFELSALKAYAIINPS